MKNHLCSAKRRVGIALCAFACSCSRAPDSASQSVTPAEATQTPTLSASNSPSPSAPESLAPSVSITPSFSPSPSPSPTSTPSGPPLDVNDISFLWPVPRTRQDVDALISLNDEAADGKLFPDELFAKLIDEAKTVGVGTARISFPNETEFRRPATWKVAAIRVNPSSLGTNPAALIRGGIIPSVRLIVQPVTVSGDSIQIHDFAAHVVFLQTFPRPDKTK